MSGIIIIEVFEDECRPTYSQCFPLAYKNAGRIDFVHRRTMVSPAMIVAYYAAWSIYSRAYFVNEIPGDKITHINYAFANIAADGRIALGDPWADVEKAFPGDTWDQPLRGNFNQLIQLKQIYNHLRTLISIGGWVRSARRWH